MSGAETLQAAFATLLPGDGLFPSATALPLAERLGCYPHFGPAASGLLAILPPGFATLEPGARTRTLQQIEAEEPLLMAAFVTAAYSLYYSDPTVLGVIAETTGYTPRAPQPEGYALPSFDAGVVAVPASRPPSFRPVGEGAGG